MIAIRYSPDICYPSIPPYHPSDAYPEYPFSKVSSSEKNIVYSAARQLFKDLNLDKKNYNTPEWNPFGDYISKGGKVAIKPNWVWDPPYCFDIPDSLLATLTHSSLIRTVIDYAYIAVGTEGRISVLDSPIEDADWNRLLTWNRFKEVFDFYKRNTDVPLEVIDLRDFRTIHTTRTLPIGKHRLGLAYRKRLPGDPRGYVKFTLHKESEFSDEKFTGFERIRSPQKWTGKRVLQYHNANEHVYYLSRTLLEADLIVNLPKLKHHKKAGVTLSLKNLIGATNKKDALPHFKIGCPPLGDEHPYPRTSMQKFKIALSNIGFCASIGPSINHYDTRKRGQISTHQHIEDKLQDIRVGDWYGADTLWRTILDLNKAALLGDIAGTLHDSRQRAYLSIIEGIVGGDKQSPLHPSPRLANILLGSEDPVALDTVATYLMGFNPRKIPTLVSSWKLPMIRGQFEPLGNTAIMFNGTERIILDELKAFLIERPQYITKFEPSVGWLGHIELG